MRTPEGLGRAALLAGTLLQGSGCLVDVRLKECDAPQGVVVEVAREYRSSKGDDIKRGEVTDENGNEIEGGVQGPTHFECTSPNDVREALKSFGRRHLEVVDCEPSSTAKAYGGADLEAAEALCDELLGNPTASDTAIE